MGWRRWAGSGGFRAPARLGFAGGFDAPCRSGASASPQPAPDPSGRSPRRSRSFRARTRRPPRFPPSMTVGCAFPAVYSSTVPSRASPGSLVKTRSSPSPGGSAPLRSPPPPGPPPPSRPPAPQTRAGSAPATPPRCDGIGPIRLLVSHHAVTVPASYAPTKRPCSSANATSSGRAAPISKTLAARRIGRDPPAAACRIGAAAAPGMAAQRNPLAWRARPITCSATARARSAPSRSTASTWSRFAASSARRARAAAK